MRTRSAHPRAAAVLLAFLAFPSASVAQSIATGGIEGTVKDAAGRPLRGALVTLGATEAEGREATVSSEGRFVLPFVLPGTYRLRAEAIGSRPLVVMEVRVGAGRTTTLDLALEAATPPVERRDTLQAAGAPSGIGGTLEWMNAPAIAGLPASRPDLAYLLSLGASVDEGMGVQGLPERLTALYIDGHVFEPARLPRSAGDPAHVMVAPRSSVAAAGLPTGSDVEWSGGAGGVVSLSTGVDRSDAPELFGSWEGSPGWSGGAIEGTPPGFNSIWAGGATSIAGKNSEAIVHVAVESGRLQRPFPAVLSDSVAGVVGERSASGDDGLDRSTWTAASLRFDRSAASGGALQLAVSAAGFKREAPGLADQRGRYPNVMRALDGLDVLGGADLARDLPGPLALEVRANGSFSRRRFGDQETPDATTTLLVAPAVALAGAPDEAGEVTRTGIGGAASVHLEGEGYRAKVGIAGRADLHRYDLLRAPAGTFLFGEATGLSESGVYAERRGSVPPITFAVPTGEAFAQYRFTPSAGVTLTVGGRYGMTILPGEAIRIDERWVNLTGMVNAQLPKSVVHYGGLAHALWEPGTDRRTLLEVGFGLEHGEVDPSALYEAIERNGVLSVRRFAGSLPEWPTAPPSGQGTTAATLTLLDPALEPPRTGRLQVAVSHRFGVGTTLRAEAALRQTDLLLRRADLNAPVHPVLTGEGDRPVLSRLEAIGGVVAPAGGSWRRFPDYDAVWALNADGWSRYRGITLGLDHSFGTGGVAFGSYTLSRTTDNLVGLTAGDVAAELSPGIPGTGGAPWDEGVSDLDVRHRLALGLSVDVPGPLLGRVGAVYRLRSGEPFTPMSARGLDVNGDGSWSNDVAWIPESDEASALLRAGGCEAAAGGAFAVRNSCLGPTVQELDLRLAVGPVRFGRAALHLTVELLDATDRHDGIRDNGLVRVEPGVAITTQGKSITLPYRLNPGFGSLGVRSDPGRQLRVGLRVGAP